MTKLAMSGIAIAVMCAVLGGAALINVLIGAKNTFGVKVVGQSRELSYLIGKSFVSDCPFYLVYWHGQRNYLGTEWLGTHGWDFPVPASKEDYLRNTEKWSSIYGVIDEGTVFQIERIERLTSQFNAPYLRVLVRIKTGRFRERVFSIADGELCEQDKSGHWVVNVAHPETR